MFTDKHVLMHFAAAWPHLQHQQVSDGYAPARPALLWLHAGAYLSPLDQLRAAHAESMPDPRRRYATVRQGEHALAYVHIARHLNKLVNVALNINNLFGRVDYLRLSGRTGVLLRRSPSRHADTHAGY